MAEKRVSVRLVAEGGRQVRAELEGVGEAEAKGFGRLSREMELANTRLAGFARRAGIAMSAAAAAATASLGLIVRSTAESAAQIRQFAQVANATPDALQRWSAGARTVGIEQEKLRALIGLLGSDDFTIKVSPDGSAFSEALKIDRSNGQVELPQPLLLPGLNAAPSPPPGDKIAVYARNRAGAPWVDVMRPSGRDFPLQPHFGVNWSPSVATTITTEGLPLTSVGTVATPTLAATNLAASMRRWRLTSAATIDAAAEQRSAGWACWRGNAAGFGGWTFVTRISLTTLQATGMGFFGLYGATAALATTLTLATVVNCIGIGFQRGTHANWQLVTNDGAGAPTLTDIGASFAIATGGVLTLFTAAAPNAASVWVQAVNEVTGTLFEQEITTDLPATTQFLSPRLYLNTGATAAAVAYDCSGVYVEADF